MKQMKKILCLLLALCLTLPCAANNEVYAISVKKLRAYSDVSVMRVGMITQIITVVTPSNATYQELTYQSSDKSVATVNSSGYVTAHKVGTCTVTVKTLDGSNIKKKVTITVKKYPSTSQETVYFGYYPQNPLEDSEITQEIIEAPYNKYGIATVNGVQYKRVSSKTTHQEIWGSDYVYFPLEPIKWRVIREADGVVTLMSDTILDAAPYNTNDQGALVKTSWEKSSLRKFLNNEFLNVAFTMEEQDAILKTKVKNLDNYYSLTSDNTVVKGKTATVKGGNDTVDQVFLLSIEEAHSKTFGFLANLYVSRSILESTNAGASRMAAATPYAYTQGITIYKNGSSPYWLRSVSTTSTYDFAAIDSEGLFDQSWQISQYGIRPVIRIKRSKLNKLT